MRHSFASRMMDGYNPNGERSSLEVSEDLGHHRTEVTAVYVGNMERAGEDTIPGIINRIGLKSDAFKHGRQTQNVLS